MQKLPVIAVITEALNIVWRKRLRLVLAVAGLVAFMSILDITSNHLLGKNDSSLSALAISLIELLASVLFAVTCHRVVLLEGDAVPRYGILSWSARETRFLGWLTAATLAFLATFVPLIMTLSALHMIPQSDEATGWTYLYYAIIMLPYAYLFSRLSILLPATALDQRNNTEWAWSLTENNGWRLTVLIVLIPALAIPLEALFTSEHLLFDLIGTVLTYVLTTIEIALLSVSFNHLSEMRKTLPVPEIE